MPSLVWNDEATHLLEEYVREHTQADGEIDWTAIASYLPGRSTEAARTHWKRIRDRSGKLGAPAGSETEEDQPSFQKLFEYLRDRQRSLKQIANHFSVSPKVIEDKIAQMDDKGYRVLRSENTVSVTTSLTAEESPPEIRVEDLRGRSFFFAVASDWHAGSKHSQPTRLNQFIKFAYEDHGVRHVMVPGDLTDGAFVYGPKHIDDLIPAVRPASRQRTWTTAEAEVELLKTYAPQMDGLRYFAIGGNHDMSLITNSGMDPIRMLCDARPDFAYGGYTLWSIRLTDKSYIRLVHPRGGASYARSYKLQKRMEQMAFEALRQAMIENQAPMTSILVMGHYHIFNFDPSPPMHGMLAGCFQGQTSLLKELGLTPGIGGWIIEVKFEKYGRLSQVWFKPVIFEEIENDWQQWPTPTIKDPDLTPDDLGVMISVTGEPPATPPDESKATSPE